MVRTLTWTFLSPFTNPLYQSRIFPISIRSCSTNRSALRKDKDVESILRVDHAGEYGADRIYQGQMRVLSNSTVAPVIQEMWDQEKEHLATLEVWMKDCEVKPTVFLPLWHVAGYALGVATAAIGEKGAMACTIAVEETIAEHYQKQIRFLLKKDREKYAELLTLLSRLRDEEVHHHDTGVHFDGREAPFYSAIKCAIQTGCKIAIWISERV